MRKKVGDSRSLYDTPAVVESALSTDFNRMLSEPRIKNLIAKQDKGVKSGGESVDGEIDEIRAALSPIYKTIIHAFEYYCLIANNVSRTAFSMGELSFQRFLQDCKLFDKKLTSEACQSIFIAVNVETDKKSKASDLNEDKCLMRMEFIEALIRMAIVKFKDACGGDIDKKLTSEACQSIFIAVNVETDKKSKASDLNEDKCLMRMEFIEALIRMAIVKFKDACGGDISDAVAMLVKECLAPNIPPQGQIDCDIFRRERFYTKVRASERKAERSGKSSERPSPTKLI